MRVVERGRDEGGREGEGQGWSRGGGIRVVERGRDEGG